LTLSRVVPVSLSRRDKEDHVDLLVEYRISKDQSDGFMSGFSELIPRDLITVFDERELEWLIGGMTEIDG